LPAWGTKGFQSLLLSGYSRGYIVISLCRDLRALYSHRLALLAWVGLTIKNEFKFIFLFAFRGERYVLLSLCRV